MTETDDKLIVTRFGSEWNVHAESDPDGEQVFAHFDNIYDAQRFARRENNARQGRTFYAGRCACYRGGPGHSHNSGRCGQTDFYTRPEHKGVCDNCLRGCS